MEEHPYQDLNEGGGLPKIGGFMEENLLMPPQPHDRNLVSSACKQSKQGRLKMHFLSGQFL